MDINFAPLLSLLEARQTDTASMAVCNVKSLYNRDKTIAPTATLLLLCGSIHRDSCREWLVTAILRRELSFTSRFSSFPCLLLPSVLCAHSLRHKRLLPGAHLNSYLVGHRFAEGSGA